MLQLLKTLRDLLDKTKALQFLAPLALRIFMAPIFILAGWAKLSNIENTSNYFEYIGLPAPELMVYLAGLSELVGGCLLVVGLATRWAAIPLMISMAVAAVSVHWENGWHALPETELTVPWEWRKDLIDEAVERRNAARSLLRQHGNYDWLTGSGPITVLKNGVEFAATYFIMLLTLFFYGAGKLSLDHLVARRLQRSG
jgi:uncharacterized membrane protein YphA (DoxX/SURF4 family)